MKRIIVITALAVMVLSTAVYGEEVQQEKEKGEKGNPPAGREKMHQELLKKFDADGDGKLSGEEMAAARAAREEKMRAELTEQFRKMDADSNGSVSLEEFIAFRMKQMEKRRDGMPGPGKERKGDEKGNNGVGNGEDPAPPGNPPENDGPGTEPGDPGNKGGI